MHTTNNVPQSRCRAFLIYGELSEMGRWSKRRWRHAEGLHFSLFSPHKQEKPVSLCHNTHKHTPTHRSKTRAHAQTQTCTTPTIYTHTCATNGITSTTDTHTHTDSPFSNTNPLSSATHNETHMDTPPTPPPPPQHTHARIYNQKLSHHHQPLTDTQGKSSGFDWTRLRTLSNEPPHALYRVCSK